MKQNGKKNMKKHWLEQNFSECKEEKINTKKCPKCNQYLGYERIGYLRYGYVCNNIHCNYGANN